MKGIVVRVNPWNSGKGFFFDTTDGKKYHAYSGELLNEGDEVEFDVDERKVLGESLLARKLKVVSQTKLAREPASVAVAVANASVQQAAYEANVKRAEAMREREREGILRSVALKEANAFACVLNDREKFTAEEVAADALKIANIYFAWLSGSEAGK